MSTHGIKVSKAGFDVENSDIRNLILHSDYDMFKYHSTLSGDIIIATGDQTGTLELTHGLGYVPAFLVYKDNSLFTPDTIAYADTNKIYITQDLGSPYNETDLNYTANNVRYDTRPGVFGNGLAYYAGNWLGSTDSSGFLWEGVEIPQGQTISSANFRLEHIAVSAGNGNNHVNFKIWGIDEDNDTDMSGSKTDAYVAIERASVSPWAEQQMDVTGIVQEIVNRGGWNSGNNISIVMEDNSTPNYGFLYTLNPPTVTDIKLEIVMYSGSGSLTSNFKVVVFKDKIA